MKATGMVRKVDELGRIVLPSELRNTLNLHERDPLEIFTEDSTIILRKYEPSCIFTDKMEDLLDYKGRKVSVQAVREMAALAGLQIVN